MGVPASPSGVFRLRFAPVPPKSRRDFPPAPLTLAGQCRYRICTRALHGVVLRCRSAGHSQNGRDRPQVHFPESATEKPGRHVRSCSGGHSVALRDRLQVEYRGTQQKSRAARHGECRARHFLRASDWPETTSGAQVQPGRGSLSAGHSATGRDRPQVTIENKKSRCHVVLTGAPQKAGERLGDDLFSLDEKQKPQAPRPTLPAKSAGSAPAVQCSRSLRKSLRDRLQGHDRGMPRKNKSRMPCFVLTGAPCKGQGAPSRRPFQSGRKSNKEAPDTPLRYVTGFNIILIKSRCATARC